MTVSVTNLTHFEEKKKRCISGIRVGAMGIIVNGTLAIIKTIIGISCGSMAILADGINNLSDAGTSVATVMGFVISSRKSDANHPAGYSRMEYICGLFVAFILCSSALALGKTAASCCIGNWNMANPVELSASALAILLLSCPVKIALAIFSGTTNKNVRSDLLQGMFVDNLADALITAGTVLALYFSPQLKIPLDSLICLPIAIYIGWTGTRMGIENTRKLL
ncbi:MAG: cation diffusion facilitator family transporter [Sphaerochaetaceae bacterium]